MELSNNIIKVAIIAQSNSEIFAAELKKILLAQMPDKEFIFHVTSIGQFERQIIDDKSSLNVFSADISYFFGFFEDHYDPYFFNNFKIDKFRASFNDYLNLLQIYCEKNKKNIFINLVTNLVALPNIVVYDIRRIIVEANACMQQKFADCYYIKFIDVDSVIKVFEKKVVDPRIKLIGRFPISQEFSKYLANIFVGYIAAVLARSIRLIIVDLDNTLWGGVVGEDGVFGIKIAGDYPGNCFSAFQRALKTLLNRGIILAIVSKNDESIVKHVFSQLDMPLKFSDFVTYRINWINKAENIRSIAEEIGLGFKNILFIDDSPVECALVKNILPDVNVLRLPNDPAYYLEKLGTVNLLNYIAIEREDLKRHRSYIQRSKLVSYKKKFCDLTDFYKSLNLIVYIDDLSAKNIARVSQLFAKTNQFNLTGVKYTIDELQKLHSNGEKVLAIRVADKYSECETMGAIVITQRDNDWDIKNFVMSCRALGKNAEHEALKAILRYIRTASMAKVYARYVETDRNQAAKDFYKQLGFNPINSNSTDQWLFDLASDIVVSDWVTVVNKV